MAFHTEKGVSGREEIILDGIENGIAPSPHLGIANIQGVNIDSMLGEGSVNYGRVLMAPAINSAANQVISASTSTNLLYNYQSFGLPKLVTGSVLLPNGTITGFSSSVSTFYWVTTIVSDSGGIQTIQLSTSFEGTAYSSFGTTGTASCVTKNPTEIVQGTSEFYKHGNYFIYYMLDTSGFVWVYDKNYYSCFSCLPTSAVPPTTIPTGFAITQGAMFVFCGDLAYWTYTTNLSGSSSVVWSSLNTLLNVTSGDYTSSHYAQTTPLDNGAIYFCDGSYISAIQPKQSNYGIYEVAGSGTTVLVNVYEQGTTPLNNSIVYALPLQSGGTLPAGVSATTPYYIWNVAVAQPNSMQLWTAAGGTGTQLSFTGSMLITTFSPPNSDSVEITIGALQCNSNEVTTCLDFVSIGSGGSIIVGTISNNLYYFSPTSVQAGVIIPLPEPNTHRILNVDNLVYIFCGNKGNIYISNGSSIAGALTVPDYIANVDGSNQDPPYVWGDVMFLRGRIWFSIQDQTATHPGNAGGVWSFTPVQNMFIGMDQGIRLSLEHQSSYGNYNGRCTVLLENQNQNANGPQYFSGWSSTYADNGTFGIDNSGTTPQSALSTNSCLIDWDLIPIGTYLPPFTPSNIEYKLARPLQSGESVSIYYRLNEHDSFTLLGTDNTVGNTAFPFPTNFQNAQWLQIRTVLNAVSSGSWVPITQVRIR